MPPSWVNIFQQDFGSITPQAFARPSYFIGLPRNQVDIPFSFLLNNTPPVGGRPDVAPELIGSISDIRFTSSYLSVRGASGEMAIQNVRPCGKCQAVVMDRQFPWQQVTTVDFLQCTAWLLQKRGDAEHLRNRKCFSFLFLCCERVHT